MAETTSAAPASSPTTPAPAPAAAPAVTAPSSTAPKLDLKLGAQPATEAPKTEAPAGDSDLLKQVAKASAAERKANAMVADLKRQLETATGSSTEAQQKAALFDAVTKDPKLLLDHGVTWDNILDSISGAEAEKPDPRHEATKAELKKLQDRIDAREKAEADAKAAAEKAEIEAVNRNAEQAVAKLVEADGSKPDADGFPRWAIVGQDPAMRTKAINAMDAHCTENKIQPTQAEALDMVAQALDQLEAHERSRVAPLLKVAADRKAVDSADRIQSQPKTSPRPELPADRFTIDSSIKSSPAPAGMKTTVDRPRTRPSTF